MANDNEKSHPVKSSDLQPSAGQTKGANPQRRTALGRGLSVLLSSSAVQVRQERSNSFAETPPPAQSAEVMAQNFAHRPASLTAENAERKVDSAISNAFSEPAPARAHSNAVLKTELYQATGLEIEEPLREVAPVLQQALHGDRTESTRPLAHALERMQLDAAEEPISNEQPLLGTADVTDETSEPGMLRHISITDVIPSPTQPRKSFNREELEALSRSISESGLLQPLVVRRNPTGETQFEIVAGERRYRAAKIAGLNEIPVIIRELDDREALGLAIIENVQRSDLNPIEEAESYQRLITEFGETQEGVAQLIGKDRVTIANALRLLRLAPAIRSYLVDGRLSAGHGRALLGIEDPVRQVQTAEAAVKESLSVRAVEKLVQEVNPNRKKAKSPSTRPPLSRSFSAVEIEDRIRRTLGTKVTLSLHSAETGEVRISFFSKAELENLLERIGA